MAQEKAMSESLEMYEQGKEGGSAQLNHVSGQGGMAYLGNMSVCLRETKMVRIPNGYSSTPGNFLSMKR